MEIDIGETRQSTNNATPPRAADKKEALAKKIIKKGKTASPSDPPLSSVYEYFWGAISRHPRSS
jgi:hypothetical protein